MIVVAVLLAIALAASYAVGLRKWTMVSMAVIGLLGLSCYALLLTSGNIQTLFTNDPYSRLYPNLWEHALAGDFGIDPAYAYREYFITYSGMPTVYFGFMPALLRGVASIFNDQIYTYNLGNISIIIAVLLAMASVWYALLRLELLHTRIRKYAISVFAALLFASPLVYTAIWGRVHNEVIAWGAAWGLIFISFFVLWVFGEVQRWRYWWGLVMGLAVGMAVLSRPTVALTIGIPYAFIILEASWQFYRTRQAGNLKRLLPGVACALVMIGLAMYINQQRWGSPLTFVKMHRHVELLRENPERGNNLKEAGEFNVNRLPSSIAYYTIPTAENITRQWPFVEIDQSLKIMNGAPQYDYIEGSRVPIFISMTFLVTAAGYGMLHMRRLRRPEQYAAMAVFGGGILTLVSLSAVYAVAVRYSADLIPLIFFGAILCLIVLSREAEDKPIGWQIGWHGLLVLSIFLTTVTTLQYKVISGQIDMAPEFRRALSQQINFPYREGAKLFIIDGKAAPGVRY